MKIYIAASWRHRLAVELLTERLRRRGCRVFSFVENAFGEQQGDDFDYDTWIASDDGRDAFSFDTGSVCGGVDLVIYLGPSGLDAWAEVGAAWASGVEVVGISGKGESIGLMRRMVEWVDSVAALFVFVDERLKARGKACPGLVVP